MTAHLGHEKYEYTDNNKKENYINGFTPKNVPRVRNNEFELIIVEKGNNCYSLF